MALAHWSAVGFAAVAVAGSAVAVERPLWELGVGAAGLRLPHYRGSDQSESWLLPVPYVVYRGDFFKADRNGARAVLFESDRIDVDLSLAAGAPTRSDDNKARAGMDDLEPTVQFGPNLNLTLARGSTWKFDLRTPLRAAITIDSEPRLIGWVATPNLNVDVFSAGGWNLGGKASLLFGNRRYNGHFYDVEPAEATAERPAYRSRAGFGGSEFTLSMSRRFERQWVGMFARYDSLHGARFDDSPLVRRRNNVSVGVAWSYVLARSSRLVVVPD